MRRRSSELVGKKKASGIRSPLASGDVRSTSCHTGSKWRSYQMAYCCTIAQVAGCVVTSSTRPSPITQTLRPSCRLSTYSAPVRMTPPSQAHDPRPNRLGGHGHWIDNAHLSPGEEDRKFTRPFQARRPGSERGEGAMCPRPPPEQLLLRQKRFRLLQLGALGVGMRAEGDQLGIIGSGCCTISCLFGGPRRPIQPIEAVWVRAL